MLNSMIYWLKKISTNKDGTITHWQIRVVFESFFSEINNLDPELQLLIFPFFATFLEAKSHTHKAIVAGFVLDLINTYQSRKKELENDPDFF